MTSARRQERLGHAREAPLSRAARGSRTHRAVSRHLRTNKGIHILQRTNDICVWNYKIQVLIYVVAVAIIKIWVFVCGSELKRFIERNLSTQIGKPRDVRSHCLRGLSPSRGPLLHAPIERRHSRPRAVASPQAPGLRGPGRGLSLRRGPRQQLR